MSHTQLPTRALEVQASDDPGWSVPDLEPELPYEAVRECERIADKLVVEPADEAIDFYCRALGATEQFRIADSDGRIAHAVLSVGDSVLYVGDPYPELGVPAGTVSHNVFVRDVDTTITEFVEAGGTVLLPPQDNYWGDRSGMVLDRFGHRWTISAAIEHMASREIVRRATRIAEQDAPPMPAEVDAVEIEEPAITPHRGSPSPTSASESTPSWPVPRPTTPLVIGKLAVPSATEAVALYERALGAKERYRAQDEGGCISHAVLQLGTALLCLGESSDATDVGRAGLNLFVTDVDATIARLTAAGATVLRAVAADGSGDRSGTLADPFGHQWTIWTLESPASHGQI